MEKTILKELAQLTVDDPNRFREDVHDMLKGVSMFQRGEIEVPHLNELYRAFRQKIMGKLSPPVFTERVTEFERGFMEEYNKGY